MALPTNRQAGDVISASDINAIATQVNSNQTALGTKLGLSGGTMTGAINMGGQALTNFRSTQTGDPATRGYVSTQVGNCLAKAGGTMTGDIAMAGHSIYGLPNPSNSSDAATMGYVDTSIASIAMPDDLGASAYKTYNGTTFTSGANLFTNNSGGTLIFSGFVYAQSSNGLYTIISTSTTNRVEMSSHPDGSGTWNFQNPFCLVVPNGATVSVTAMQLDLYTDIAVPYITGTAYRLYPI